MGNAATKSLDYPFYAGAPVAIGGRGWLFLMASVALAFAVLVAMPVASFPASLLPALLFAGIPLAALALLTGRCWTALFRSVGPRELCIILLTSIGAILASGAAGVAISELSGTVANPVADSMRSMSAGEFVLRLVPTAPQLLGEELLTILPFLAILWFATQRLGLSKPAAIMAALAGSTALFASAHLPTYHWNFAQCFGVIGTARIVLTLSYVLTRNLWVPVGAHILNDWAEFTFIFSLGHVPINAG